MAEIIFNREKCDFCGTCVGICPEDAIELRESELSITEKCTKCSKCVWCCPYEALKFEPGKGAADGQ